MSRRFAWTWTAPASTSRRVALVNDSPGEVGIPVRASELDAEHGFYIRRGQEARVALGGDDHRARAHIASAPSSGSAASRASSWTKTSSSCHEFQTEKEETMAKLRLGVIGAGSWAIASHLPNFAKRRDEVEFVGVCRKGPELLEKIKHDWGFQVASEDYRDVIDAGMDICLVASPHGLHSRAREGRARGGRARAVREAVHGQAGGRVGSRRDRRTRRGSTCSCATAGTTCRGCARRSG